MTMPAKADIDNATRDALAGLTVGDLEVLEELLELREAEQQKTGLDARTFALVKVAALVALDAPPASYLWQVANASTLVLRRQTFSACSVRSPRKSVGPGWWPPRRRSWLRWGCRCRTASKTGTAAASKHCRTAVSRPRHSQCAAQPQAPAPPAAGGDVLSAGDCLVLGIIREPEVAERHLECRQSAADHLLARAADCPARALALHRRADRLQRSEHVCHPSAGLIIRGFLA